MSTMRESWTDERLDDLVAHVDRRFEEVDRRFDGVDRRLDGVGVELHRINDRLDGLHRLMLQTVVTMSGATIAGFVALAGLILTQH